MLLLLIFSSFRILSLFLPERHTGGASLSSLSSILVSSLMSLIFFPRLEVRFFAFKKTRDYIRCSSTLDGLSKLQRSGSHFKVSANW